MKKPARWLKRKLSHFFELNIESHFSQINGALAVTLINGQYVLGTENAIYSEGDQYSSFKAAFDHIKPENRNVKSALILGVGLGSIPQILKSNHGVDCHYTAVDIDPVILALAKKYGAYPADKTDLIQADAYDYVRDCKLQFDLVNVDLYIDDKIPSQFDKVEFLEGLKKRIAPSGVLIFSRFYTNEKHQQITDTFVENTFQHVFPNYYKINISGNLMLMVESLSLPEFGEIKTRV